MQIFELQIKISTSICQNLVQLGLDLDHVRALLETL